jgi:serine/threonine protein kinase/Tol biopolymer transport system component
VNRTLHPQDHISHFRVIQPLGGGGMGEVYVATDESLQRDVALKILPPRLVRDEDRLRRFVTEARSASSLNHPNIVTIYEIGKDRVRGSEAGGEDSTAEPVHFISMELVTGETLSAKIYESKSDLRSLIGYVAQAAEGIAKAHNSGIVHRDLKPANIMVSNDGFAKVLDFGLAKLTEHRPEPLDDRTEDPTRAMNTGEGLLIGTVGYMSPEQVQANPVDHRSDIFSLGCILYEAAAKRRPFVAPTPVEVMHHILRERPTPIEELNPDVPSEVRRIIRRCLAKNPDQRFQSMKDLALELREVCDEYESLPSSGSSGAALAPGSLLTKPPLRRAAMAAMIVVGLLGAGGIAFGIVSAIGGRARTASAGSPGKDLGLSVLMTRNDLTEATLSNDGRYLSFVSTKDDKSTLNVRQVRTGSDVQIVPPQDYFVRGVSFSPDGDYLYYLNQDPDSPAYSALFQVPSLGGTPQKILFDIDTAAGFSPDGSRLCFRRGMPQIQMDTLVVADVASRQEKELIRIQSPEAFQSAPAWSPDGRSVAVGVQNIQGGVRAWVRVIDVASGRQQTVGPPSLFSAVNSVGWLPGGGGIVLSGFVPGTAAPQVFRVGYPGGAVSKLTNDLSGYGGVSVSAAGGALAAVRRTGVANVWVAPADSREGAAHAITTATGTTGSSRESAPLPGGAVAFTVAESDKTHIWRAEADGSSRKQLEAQGLYASSPRFAEKSGIVFAELDEKSGMTHIWRIDPDGSHLRQLTDGKGETFVGLSQDGRTLLFKKWDDVAGLWSLDPSSGAAPTRLATDALDQAALISPDGRLISYGTFTTVQDRIYTRLVVIPAQGGAPVAQILLPPGATRNAWSPDNASLTYVDRNRGWNLMRQPIAGGAPSELTRFSDGQTTDFVWSPDGRRIAVVRKISGAQSIWLVDPRGGEPVKLAEFATGDIFGCRWSIDGKSVLFTYATSTQDVVLIKNVA